MVCYNNNGGDIMRLGWAKTKYSISYCVKKTVYVNGKNKDIVVKRLGSEKQICEKYGVTDAKAWAKEQVRLMNEAEKEDAAKFNIELCAGTDLVMDEQRRFNGGYLFLQDIYYELGLHKICRAISSRHLFKYDLNDILSRLIYTRILFPASKKRPCRSLFLGARGTVLLAPKKEPGEPSPWLLFCAGVRRESA